ncbi:hypothetical protein CYMTET_22194 [Cymbomonas tetramitiformis]|uniref:RING-type domain-containing protein n=1 Tax=Cymbomonas tetramitiformis TaxID=36881 RepID=A0AAE0G0D4_9CHLO|nr:hypothetical protein CYMTET_22194 [Cymbomonas tetramitiformis]
MAEQLVNPDRMLNWDSIVQVERPALPDEEELRCPICLDSPPVCPQMTECGHIFCFPCMMRVLMQGDGLRCTPPCPLCFAPVSLRELRFARLDTVSEAGVGSTLKMVQIVRQKDLMVPVQRLAGESCSASVQARGQEFPLVNTPVCLPHPKFSRISDPNCVTEAAVGELTALAAEVTKEGSQESQEILPFIYHAVDALDRRTRGWLRTQEEARQLPLRETSPPPLAAVVDAKATLLEAQYTANGQADAAFNEDEPAEDWPSLPPPLSMPDPWVLVDESASSGEEAGAGSQGAREVADGAVVVQLPEGEDPSVEVPAPPTPTGASQGADGDSESSIYTFFQVEDGRAIVLHPLNMRMLLQHYPSFDSLPAAFESEVLEVEEVVQCEVTRRRYKFLSHFPATVNFQLVEVDMRKVLPEAALAPFQEELNKRAKRRQAAARKSRERAIKDKATAALAANNGLSDGEVKRMPSLQETQADILEAWSADDGDLAAALAASCEVDRSLEVDGGGRAVSAAMDVAAPAGPSFARVADLGYASGHNAPILMGSSASPPLGGGVWGALSASPPAVPISVSQSPPGGSWASMAGTSTASASLGGAGAGTKVVKKGRKGKQTTLLFTTSQRGRSD